MARQRGGKVPKKMRPLLVSPDVRGVLLRAPYLAPTVYRKPGPHPIIPSSAQYPAPAMWVTKILPATSPSDPGKNDAGMTEDKKKTKVPGARLPPLNDASESQAKRAHALCQKTQHTKLRPTDRPPRHRRSQMR